MRIFLSYHTPDHALAKALEAGLLARDPRLDIYFAPRSLSAGAYWLPALSEEIGRCDAVLFLAGKRIGPWQELEYYEAMNLARQPASRGRPRVVPVVTADRAPGLPFFALLHQIWTPEPASAAGLDAVLSALHQDAAAPDVPAWRRFQPYKGLAALSEQDAAFFTGREREMGAVLDLLVEAPDTIITLIGASGSGKSSLARAGVLASLQSQIAPRAGEAWPAALADSRSYMPLVMRPGTEPLRELALACAKLYAGRSFEIDAETDGWSRRFAAGGRFRDLLRETRSRVAETAGHAPPRRFILYVDQAEEMYTRATRTDAEAFGRLVAEAADQDDLSVLLSLRSDFYAPFQQDPHLFGRAERVDVLPLSEAALTDAVRRPALSLGTRFESPEMPARIAAAAAREPGALPLLSDYMHDLWLAMQARDDGVLRWGDAPAEDGLSAPLNRRAEAFLARPGTDPAVVRRLFTLRLAQVQSTGEPVRRVARRGECSDAEWRVAEMLADEAWRLLILSTRADTGESCAEVAHEQLLRRWPRLADWLAEERDFLAWKGGAEQAAAQYLRTAGPDRPDALLMGQALTIARGWQGLRGADFAPELAGFIDASIAADDAATAARADTEQRLVRAELAAAQFARDKAETERAALQERLRRTKLRMMGVAAACLLACCVAGGGYMGLRRWQTLRDDRDATNVVLAAFMPSSQAGAEPNAGAVGGIDNRAKIKDAVAYVRRHPENRQLLIAVQILLATLARTGEDAAGSAEAAAQRVDLARAADAASHDATTGILLGNSLIAEADAALSDGRSAAGAAAFREALRTFEALPSDDPARLHGIAQAHERLGYWAILTGDPQLAESESRAAIAAFGDLAERQPDAPEAQDELAAALANAAIAARMQDQDDAALSFQQRAVAIRRSLAARHPGRFAERLALTKALALLAAVAAPGSAVAQDAQREGRAMASSLAADARQAAADSEDLRNAEDLLTKFGQPPSDTGSEQGAAKP